MIQLVHWSVVMCATVGGCGRSQTWCCGVLKLQTTARRNGIPIDSLVFEHGIVNLDEREINGPPKEGVYIKGLFLEGGCAANCRLQPRFCS